MKILRLTGGIALLLLVFASCSKEVSYYEEEIPEGNIVMKNQKPQRVSDAMILEIIEIVDNRCPVGVVCSGVGVVQVGFKAYINGEFKEMDMAYEDLFNGSGCTTNFEGHSIQILQVNPMPFSGQDINANDYRIEIKVDKL